MSRLNELDAELALIPNTPKEIVKLWSQKLRELSRYSYSRIDKETVELLVCCTHHLGEITEGRAAEILGLFRLDFRDLYLKWEKDYTENSE
ncbi:hypothetical protein [Crocosphaera chwakensis]|uniref:Uncharacterized protein n=1 Tax=Crocosphaera chwakensis CCY0110 TaxID=391612 RepID=A3IY30_9CHRO|nr:hypothetical protein [Crocosphaera chwakensis]EAZ88606.1 hypothetical protein CY0110_31415 [Crocosphaera chwakensis CCY0110]